MIKFKIPHLYFYHLIFTFVFLCSLFVHPENADAGDTIISNIRVIHATSDGSSHIDSELNDLAHQLQSVFKYTSYRLLDSKEMTIAYNTTGSLSLPGGRVLEIIPGGMSGDRIKFSIRILKNHSQVFSTQILLKNGSSVTIGGPDFKNGYLLFNISGISH
ncbi:MAG: hypothetical protein HQK65_02760 [Desulfamplus sp.]|nr:hypothetical protein [Desulfamplus sp.]